jgi:hypothetical protein
MTGTRGASKGTERKEVQTRCGSEGTGRKRVPEQIGLQLRIEDFMKHRYLKTGGI